MFVDEPESAAAGSQPSNLLPAILFVAGSLVGGLIVAWWAAQP